jgi:hypothetical protein
LFAPRERAKVRLPARRIRRRFLAICGGDTVRRIVLLSVHLLRRPAGRSGAQDFDDEAQFKHLERRKSVVPATLVSVAKGAAQTVLTMKGIPKCLAVLTRRMDVRPFFQRVTDLTFWFDMGDFLKVGGPRRRSREICMSAPGARNPSSVGEQRIVCRCISVHCR